MRPLLTLALVLAAGLGPLPALAQSVAPAEPVLEVDPVEIPLPPLEEEYPRFRGGVSGVGGPLFLGPTIGAVVGVQGRLGLQVNRYFGLYAQPIAFVGHAALLGLGVLADLTLGGTFFVAAGPGGFFAVPSYATPTGPTGADAARPLGTGVDFTGRVGIALGRVRYGRHRAFVLSAELHTLFSSGSSGFVSPGTGVLSGLGLGYESF